MALEKRCIELENCDLRAKMQNKRILVFILIAYLFSWGIEFIAIFQMNSNLQFTKLSKYLFFSQFGPTIAAIITLLFFDGFSHLKETINRIFVFRFSYIHYLFILFTIPLALFFTLKLFGITPKDKSSSLLIYITLFASPINGILGGLFNGVGPLGEEFGWRGFLLPQLLLKYNDIKSSIILGIIWAFWHFPIFFFDEFRNGLSFLEFVMLYPVSIILISYFMTSAWRLSKSSIFVAIWVHGIFNVALSYISNNEIWELSHLKPISLYLIILFSLLLACIIIRLRSLKIKSIKF